MTAREKATNLLDKMDSAIPDRYSDDHKKCALIAVDEIINIIIGLPIDAEFGLPKDYIFYWEKVKEEIEKL